MGLAASRQEAFWEACGFGDLERAKKLLEGGEIDVNWVSYTNDCCPIHVASQGKPDIVQLLLDNNCNVNVKDIRGNSALHHAAMKGHADIIQTLIDAGVEVDVQEKNGWTALHNAAYWCHPDAVRVLIKNGCDVNLQNKDERTALHETARSQQTKDDQLGEIARMLIEAGSDINAKSSDLGEADLTGLMYASYHNHPEVSLALIDAGCELNCVGTTFWTALHWAADRGNDELVYILLEAGIDPTKKGMRGELASDRAKSDDVKEVLLNAVNIHKEMLALEYKKSCSVKMVKPVSQPVEKPVTEKVKLSWERASEGTEIVLGRKILGDPLPLRSSQQSKKLCDTKRPAKESLHLNETENKEFYVQINKNSKGNERREITPCSDDSSGEITLGDFDSSSRKETPVSDSESLLVENDCKNKDCFEEMSREQSPDKEVVECAMRTDSDEQLVKDNPATFGTDDLENTVDHVTACGLENCGEDNDQTEAL